MVDNASLENPHMSQLAHSNPLRSLVDDACDLDMRENEILFFLLIIIMVKSRKSGATHTAAAYLASGFIYAKIANVILFFRLDPRMGLVYTFFFLLQAMLLPEPTYKGLMKFLFCLMIVNTYYL